MTDNQLVDGGELLVRLDDRDFRVALDQARADVEAARSLIASKQAALDVQQSIIAAAQAAVDVDKANQTFAEQEDDRYARLAATGYGSVQNAQQAASRVAAARASSTRDTASLGTATKQLSKSPMRPCSTSRAASAPVSTTAPGFRRPTSSAKSS